MIAFVDGEKSGGGSKVHTDFTRIENAELHIRC